jgi:RNA polymerase sigma factor (sigma-70 family)
LIVNDELIKQWEPKVQRFVNNTYIPGFDREDLAQELRIVIIKAAEKFDVAKKTSFHTYLHTSMVNTIRTLHTKSARRPRYVASLGASENSDSGDWEFSGYEVADETDDIEAVLDKIDLEVLDLSDEESDYLVKRLTGFSNTEIGKGINGVSLYKIKRALKEKFNNYYGSLE